MSTCVVVSGRVGGGEQGGRCHTWRGLALWGRVPVPPAPHHRRLDDRFSICDLDVAYNIKRQLFFQHPSLWNCMREHVRSLPSACARVHRVDPRGVRMRARASEGRFGVPA